MHTCMQTYMHAYTHVHAVILTAQCQESVTILMVWHTLLVSHPPNSWSTASWQAVRPLNRKESRYPMLWVCVVCIGVSACMEMIINCFNIGNSYSQPYLVSLYIPWRPDEVNENLPCSDIFSSSQGTAGILSCPWSTLRLLAPLS